MPVLITVIDSGLPRATNDYCLSCRDDAEHTSDVREDLVINSRTNRKDESVLSYVVSLLPFSSVRMWESSCTLSSYVKHDKDKCPASLLGFEPWSHVSSTPSAHASTDFLHRNTKASS